MYRISCSIRSCALIVLMLTLAAVFCTLGVWQIHRRTQKNLFIETIKHNISSPAVLADHITSDMLYAKITMAGKFLANQTVFLYGRRSAYPEKDGYYILTPFQSSQGQTYLVSRGWIAHHDKVPASAFFQQEIEDTIEAIVLPGEKGGFMLPKNDQSRNIWFIIDLQAAHQNLNITEDKFYLLQIGSNTIPSTAKKLSATNLINVRNDHMEYAITWFSLAGALCIMLIVRRWYNKART